MRLTVTERWALLHENAKTFYEINHVAISCDNLKLMIYKSVKDALFEWNGMGYDSTLINQSFYR